jgi:hypothetical protein
MSEHIYSQGDKIVVQRGKHRGDEGRVLAVDHYNQNYAIQFEDSSLDTIRFVNVREPVVQTYQVKDVAEVLQRLIDRGTDRGLDTAQAFLDEAEESIPGLRDLLSWPVRVAEGDLKI